MPRITGSFTRYKKYNSIHSFTMSYTAVLPILMPIFE